MKERYSKDQILVLIGACLFQGAMLGVLVNCTGVLFAQIRHELGFSMSRISVYNTIKCVATALAAAYITARYFKSNKKRFLLLNQLVLIASYFLIAWDAAGVTWYISAIVGGVASCMSNLAVPMVLSRWFPKNPGSAAGLAMSFSGISGAVCNPLCAKLIEWMGWRGSVYVLGFVMIAMTLPGLYLMFRKDAPTAEAEKKQEQAAESARKRAGMGKIILLCFVFAGGSIGVQFAVNVSMFAQSIGYTLAVGASLTTMVMIGNVCGKFIYGLCCDRIGTWKATSLGFGTVAISLLGFLLCPGQLPVLYISALIYGFVYALAVVAITRCCISTYGEQESKHYLGIHTSINSVLMAGTSLLVGILFDRAQSFTPVLILFLAVELCALAATFLISSALKKEALQAN